MYAIGQTEGITHSWLSLAQQEGSRRGEVVQDSIETPRMMLRPQLPRVQVRKQSDLSSFSWTLVPPTTLTRPNDADHCVISQSSGPPPYNLSPQYKQICECEPRVG